MLQLLLVDDQTLIRRGLKAVLKPEPDLTVLGEAGNGLEALAWLRSTDQMPDVILMDVRMPEMDGVSATQAIAAEFPTVKILILTTFDDTEYVMQALQNGASGYLLKDTPAEELVQAIQLVQKGYTQLAPGLAQKLMVAPPPSPVALDPPSFAAENDVSLAELTPREQEILQLIATGSSNREIAQQLYISEKTVKNHITNLLGRLGLRDRTQAAVWWHTRQTQL
ncbi:response regulator transcription factor [filamentous cyanobacterium LEGE 11480]|uniref:Response regulator transcription factor n=1 Tax=Romeriopsis navalis LEGE 11480 TaxID=2777977 RepID=A0A928Z1E2_9CYAN|nr:response regulator transcription factor [Romeriopsis navalis]MBE9029251.1 response regulator transcription factor [Romeriopsis navalis LEGE 11480]